MFLGDRATIGMDNDISRGKILTVRIGAGEPAGDRFAGQWELYQGRIFTGELHSDIWCRRGRSPLAAPPDQYFPFVLQNHHVVLVDADRAYARDTRLVRSAILALQHFRKCA